MSGHSTSERPQSWDAGEQPHKKPPQEDREPRCVGRDDEHAQDIRPRPLISSRIPVHETPSLSLDISSPHITLPQFPGQVRIRDSLPGTPSSSSYSSPTELAPHVGTRATSKRSARAPAGSPVSEALSIRGAYSPAYYTSDAPQSVHSIPLQDLKVSSRTGLSRSDDDDATGLSKGEAPAIPYRNPRRLSWGIDGITHKSVPSRRPNPMPDQASASAGTASRPGPIGSTDQAPFTSLQTDQTAFPGPVPEHTHRAPVLPSRNPRRDSSSIVTTTTSGHEEPGSRRLRRPSIKTSAPLMVQQDSQRGSLSRKNRARAEGRRLGVRAGLPATTNGREVDSGDSNAGSTITSSNPSTMGQNSSVSERTKTSSISSTQERREALESLNGIRNDVMVNYLYQQALTRSYVSAVDPWQGIVLKEKRGKYSCCPPQLSIFENGLLDNVKKMNVCCAMTVSTPVTRTILEGMAQKELGYVPIPNGLRVQVLKTMSDLPQCQVHHFAAFIEDLMILVVWDDDPELLLQRAETLEESFVTMIWVGGGEIAEEDGNGDPKALPGKGIDAADPRMLEAGKVGQERRPVRIVSSIIVALTICLATTCMGFGWRRLAIECKVDRHFPRLVLVLLAPVQLFFSMVRKTSLACHGWS